MDFQVRNVVKLTVGNDEEAKARAREREERRKAEEAERAAQAAREAEAARAAEMKEMEKAGHMLGQFVDKALVRQKKRIKAVKFVQRYVRAWLARKRCVAC